MLNKVIIMGRLTRDPEFLVTQSGVHEARFSIACDRDYKNSSGVRETDYITCVAWRFTADFIKNYFSKGRMIIITGQLQQWKKSYSDGTTKSGVQVVAENVHFGDSRQPEKNEAQNDVPVFDDSDIPF